MTTGEVIALIKAFGSGGGGGSSGGGVLVVHDVDGTLDKTWKEIYDAGVAVCEMGEDFHLVLTSCMYNDRQSSYTATFYDATYSTDSKNGYPSLHTT